MVAAAPSAMTVLVTRLDFESLSVFCSEGCLLESRTSIVIGGYCPREYRAYALRSQAVVDNVDGCTSGQWRFPGYPDSFPGQSLSVA